MTHCSNFGSKDPIKSSHFVKTVDLSIKNTWHLMTLLRPSKWIKAMVSFFYDERIPMDVDTPCGVLVLARSYDIPLQGSLAI
ncbi:hypothetical protein B0I73DRAFT_163157 [Yarrowia lipolytica]|uniref:YALI0A13255p n=1 Tax=Yarrowia lipolytica (strain CLIB 122 / E 150) TaxID=284591 RepID=Q6CH29_YARLI|nr:YALI0A13255p [Yarrowia lipolytica CLIB122]RDW37202.1 hypothetical protein B0I73DRAFT_163157 [Yarrowia lipolytica]RDW43581.1 hypothetical protein B0I74DRAFT_161875 [Yarrowia lipolytica]RDW50420.1 hypothetical protein B0I75DRAFT_167399 [Yarrowia lipolytica]CAG83962.1 YALI0A13255p [Yarrowia lipolytica CLIB122]|eukprot:XP_500033.1 YALI0A13255p [Yarrowia lipolytica CLIB122]